MSFKIVAHRGESQAAPENTVESFAVALARGVTAIEGDFQTTSDGVVVCAHDTADLRRTARCGRAISTMTLAEVKRLDVGLWRGSEWRYSRIPTLDEVLDLLPRRGELYLELKSRGSILEAIAKSIVDHRLMPEQVTFIAFDEITVTAAKSLFPNHRAYWLTDLTSCGHRLNPEELVDKLTMLGADGADIDADCLLSGEYIEALHRHNLECHVWTVDDSYRAAELFEWGVDSVTSNRASALINELNHRFGEKK